MQKEELRIGNWVTENGRLIHIHDGFGIDHAQKFEPIKLTKEWLNKFGFVSNGVTYELPNFRFQISRPLNYEGFVFCDGYSVITEKIQYVHQLQNLYFALTGEELETSADALQ